MWLTCGVGGTISNCILSLLPVSDGEGPTVLIGGGSGLGGKTRHTLPLPESKNQPDNNHDS